MNRLIWIGARELARGARRGYPGWTGLGGLMLGVGLIRRFTKQGPELLYSKKLKPGQGVRIRVSRRDEDLEA